jgi:ubiquitin C-terminal hydrolase
MDNNDSILIPKGITNMGNTCYFNSCIQILSRLTPLTNIILNHELEVNKTEINLNVWNNFKDVVKLLQHKSSKRETILPSGLLSSIQVVSKYKKKNFFINKDQEDVTEFLLFFIEILHNCINAPVDVQISGMSKNNTDNLAIDVYKMLKSEYEINYSTIKKMFEGVTVNTINDINDTNIILSKKAEIFNNFILHVPKIENKSIDIYTCLDNYFKPEIMAGENKWFNDKTNKYMDVSKNTKVWTFPEILIVTLNRLNNDGSKLDNHIEFCETIDLTKYVIGYKKETVYELFGVCNHIQTSFIGHYTSFFKDEDNWYYSNDDVIQKVEQFKDIISKHAYCLFYIKKNKNL